jgi:hypothetical protein
MFGNYTLSYTAVYEWATAFGLPFPDLNVPVLNETPHLHSPPPLLSLFQIPQCSSIKHLNSSGSLTT